MQLAPMLAAHGESHGAGSGREAGHTSANETARFAGAVSVRRVLKQHMQGELFSCPCTRIETVAESAMLRVAAADAALHAKEVGERANLVE